jgi:predicted amidohydrolase
MDIAAIQFDVRDDEPLPARVDRMAGLVGEQRGADLVVLPELWPNGGFAYRTWSETAQPLDGAITAVMRKAAVDAGVWLHMGSFVERHSDGSLTNTSVLFDPEGEQRATYRKIHLFGFGEGEPALMSAGAEVVVADTGTARLGLSTCYDVRFPELYRRLVDAGAQVLVIPAAWPAARVEHWTVLSRARASEDQCVVVSVNTAGTHAGKQMGGHSLIVDARGVVLAEAGEDEAVLRVEVNVDDVAAWRTSFPALDDRRL